MTRFAVLALAAALAACGGGGSRPQSISIAPPPEPAGAREWTGRAEVGAAIEQLNRGEPDAARKRLMAYLRGSPGDPLARSLLRQIDGDPRLLLGDRSFAYVTRPGDSLSALAQRHLGDPMLFWALARYNDLASSGPLEPGRTLRIPGRDRREAMPARKVNRPQVRATAPAPAVAAKPQPSPVPTRNPARAAQLRAAGLEQLNRGAVDRAILLLRQASAADPANALVQRDLERATRIRRAVAPER